MRNKTILALLVSLAAVTPVQAQDRGLDGSAVPSSGIVDSAVRTALRMELQPTTQRVVGGRPALFWVGIAMMAGGAALAALSGSVLADKYESGAVCYPEYDVCDLGSQEVETNDAVLYGGGGLVAAGAVLMLMNRSQHRQAVTTFVPTRGGGAIFRTVTF